MAEVKVLQLQQPPVAGASQDAHSSGLISYLAKKKKALKLQTAPKSAVLITT